MRDQHEQGRRAWLRAIAAGGALGASGWIAAALAKGDLGPGKGVVRLEGTASVNNKPARIGTPVAPGDRVATGANSMAVIVVGEDAFLLRANTDIQTKGGGSVLTDLLVGTGKVLSVFSKKPLAIKAATASIGIRGTGAYIEVDPASVYFCLCYGEALVQGPGMKEGVTVKTTHHEQPLVLTESGGQLRAAPGGFRDHTDAELIMLEALVGREPPFTKGGTYPVGKY